ncbi:hypothetical protein KUTeg_021811 [Tegillarca granosa]|uniref:Uncharacterized protein n=1 Tax=Tegillarca granosa TaxID=220873 RepID=A0ABQ9E4U7_TEGGR|nr:hypothetical protein KUTeg_021811 [Tegillarca granosa]
MKKELDVLKRIAVGRIANTHPFLAPELVYMPVWTIPRWCPSDVESTCSFQLSQLLVQVHAYKKLLILRRF